MSTIYAGNWANTRSASSYDNGYTHANRQLDMETGLYYYTWPRPSGDGTSLFVVTTTIVFKKDDLHDPRLCEFRQFVCRQSGLKIVVGRDEDGNPQWREFRRYDDTWRDDGYSRADDMDGNDALEDPHFMTVDGPNSEGPISDRYFIDYRFKSQQAVYDIARQKWVAATPAATLRITEQVPCKIDINPKPPIHGEDGEPVVGDFE